MALYYIEEVIRAFLELRYSSFAPSTFGVCRKDFRVQHAKILAGVAGFEPTSDGVKVRCLTAWLYPNDTVFSQLSVCCIVRFKFLWNTLFKTSF